MTLLATFVHISDLHFGTLDRRTGNGSTTADIRVLASTISLFQASLGHQARSLRELQSYLEGLANTGESFELLVTGDFSRCGDLKELALADGYIGGNIVLKPSTAPTGLKRAMACHVAGNHDHWGAYNSPFSTTSTLFPLSTLQPASGFPYVAAGPSLLGRKLVWLGIDSDADVQPGSSQRIFAHGHFVSQVTTLESLIGPNTADELRVLLIHHARHARGHLLRMSNDSKRRLDAFCVSRGVRVVLSGHTHKPHAGTVATTLEISCPSTTQIDTPPSGWVNVLGRHSTDPFGVNGFFIHRLHEDGGKIRCDAHMMIRDPGGLGFVPSKLTQVRHI